MKKFAKLLGIVTLAHIVLTVLVAVAMKTLFTLNEETSLQGTVNNIVITMWIAVLQPYASIWPMLKQAGIRLPDSWVVTAGVVIVNSFAASWIIVSFWMWIRKLINLGNHRINASGNKAADSPRTLDS